MNLEKMRKGNARRTPDTLIRVFNVLDEDVEQKRIDWVSRFGKHMEIKHGKKADSISVYLEDTDQTHLKKVVLKVNLI